MFTEQLRELSRAVALGDLQGATIILDLMARDRGGQYQVQIDLGRSDAANIRRRETKPAILRAA